MKRYTFYFDSLSDCMCSIDDDAKGEWVKWEDVCKIKKTKEFCQNICCNQDEFNLFQKYGRECPNCPVEVFMDYYGLGEG